MIRHLQVAERLEDERSVERGENRFDGRRLQEIRSLPLGDPDLALGRALLHRCMAEFVRGNFRGISLTVTEGNDEACKLYADFGFSTLHRFDAMVWDSRA